MAETAQNTKVDTLYKCVKRTEKLNTLFNSLPKEEAINIMLQITLFANG
jgi:hypothetical protein